MVLFQTLFNQDAIFWHANKNISRMPYPISLKFSGIPFHVKHYTISGKNMSSIDPK